MPPYRLRKAPVQPTAIFNAGGGTATPTAGSVSSTSLAPSLLECFKYVPAADAVITPGVDTGGTHTDSGALAFGSRVVDSQSAWNGTQWTVQNNARFRVHVRAKLTGCVPGNVFQLSLIQKQTGTDSVLAIGPWTPTVTDDQGNDQADVSLDEVVPVAAGAVVEVHIKWSNLARGATVTMKAPTAYSANGAIPNGPYVAGSFIEVLEVVNA